MYEYWNGIPPLQRVLEKDEGRQEKRPYENPHRGVWNLTYSLLTPFIALKRLREPTWDI